MNDDLRPGGFPLWSKAGIDAAMKDAEAQIRKKLEETASGYQHECLTERAFGVDLPCAFCAPYQLFLVEVGPVRGLEKRPDGRKIAVRSDARFQKHVYVITGIDERKHVFGHWVFEKFR